MWTDIDEIFRIGETRFADTIASRILLILKNFFFGYFKIPIELIHFLIFVSDRGWGYAVSLWAITLNTVL